MPTWWPKGAGNVVSVFTNLLVARKYDPVKMVKTARAFRRWALRRYPEPGRTR